MTETPTSEIVADYMQLQPRVTYLREQAQTLGVTPEWLNTLPKKLQLHIQANKPYAMQKTLDRNLNQAKTREQIQRSTEEIKYARGAIREEVATLYAELFTLGATSGYELPYGTWKNMPKNVETHPDRKKIEIAMELKKKEGTMEVLSFLASNDKEHVLYEAAKQDKKRIIPNHP